MLNPKPDEVTFTGNQFQWTPTEIGLYDFVVVVSDGEDTAEHPFQIRVVDPAANTPPEILSTPRDLIGVGQRLWHQLEVRNDEGDTLSFRLVDAPSGMTVDSAGVIDWTPTSDHVAGSPYTYFVEVSDGVNPWVRSDAFTISVASQVENNRPKFDTAPRTNLVVDEWYVYDADATDPDGDTLTYSLVHAPPGMTIDTKTGRVQWQPKLDDLESSPHKMTVRVVDALGLGLDQTVDLTVRAANQYPKWDFDPQSQAVLNTLYTIQARAVDPDGHKVRYEFGAATNIVPDKPIGEDGTIEWTPSATGVYTIQVNAYDEYGLGISITFDVQVLASAPNQGPTFDTHPLQYVEAGTPYVYDADATDPENQTVTYQLHYTDLEVGTYGFDDDTGVLTWTDPGPVGRLATFEVWATDGTNVATYWFQVLVTEANAAPTLAKPADQTLAVGQQWTYPVEFDDANDDPLTFTLDQASRDRGMEIDGKGVITWQPGAEHITATGHDVTVSVTDSRIAAPVTQTFKVYVAEHDAAPTVRIEVSAAQAGVGQEVAVFVRAEDNVAITSRTLTLTSVTRDAVVTSLNRTLTLDGDGRALLVLTEDLVGTLTFNARATDPSKLTGTAEPVTMLVTIPDGTPPEAVIVTPGEDQQITEPVDVIGTVNGDGGVVTWTLTAAALDGGDEKLLGSGETAIDKGVLGRFDPTLLRNGKYELRLTATDADGTMTDTVTVEVAGALKLGNFTMSFVDLELGLPGLPITVSRTYDTLRADRQGDFGYGWTLDLSNTKVEVERPAGVDVGFFGYTPFVDGTRVVITLPDGTTEGFTFYGEPGTAVGSAILDYCPRSFPISASPAS